MDADNFAIELDGLSYNRSKYEVRLHLLLQKACVDRYSSATQINDDQRCFGRYRDKVSAHITAVTGYSKAVVDGIRARSSKLGYPSISKSSKLRNLRPRYLRPRSIVPELCEPMLPSSTVEDQKAEDQKNAAEIYNVRLGALNVGSDFDRLSDTARFDLKEIAGANNDCWVRAAWASAIIQMNHERLRGISREELYNRLKFTLGENLEPSIVEAASRIATGFSNVLDIKEIFTSKKNFLTDPSRIKYKGEDASAEVTQAESDIKLITAEILKKNNIPKEEIDSSLWGSESGDVTIIFCILKSLGCKGLVKDNLQKQMMFDKDFSLTQLVNTPKIVINRSHFNIFILKAPVACTPVW